MQTIPSFDELVEINRHSPADLEALRTGLIKHTIDQAPEATRRRLNGLQFQIEMERRRASNALAACIKISRMMHESLGELTSLLRPESSEGYGIDSPPRQTANVIPLRAQEP